MNREKHRDILDENLFQSAQDFQQDNSQDNERVAMGQVSECPWVAQPEPVLEPGQTSLEKIAGDPPHPT